MYLLAVEGEQIKNGKKSFKSCQKINANIYITNVLLPMWFIPQGIAVLKPISGYVPWLKVAIVVKRCALNKQ